MRPNTILLGVIFMFLMAITAVVLNQDNSNSRLDILNSDESNESSESVAVDTIILSSNMSYNVTPGFSVGSVWKYRYIDYSHRDDKTNTNTLWRCDIEKIERFNKSDCFLIVSNSTRYINNMLAETRIIKTCVDKSGRVLFANGILYSTNFQPLDLYEEGENASAIINIFSSTGMFLYGEWMLSLTEGMKWKQNLSMKDKRIRITRNRDQSSLNYTTSSERIGVEQHIFEGKVVGKEKINNKECFKVEIKEKRVDMDGKISINNYVCGWTKMKEHYQKEKDILKIYCCGR